MTGIFVINVRCVYLSMLARTNSHGMIHLPESSPLIPARSQAPDAVDTPLMIAACGALRIPQQQLSFFPFLFSSTLLVPLLPGCLCIGSHTQDALLQAESQLDCCFHSSPYQHRLLPLPTRHVNKSPTPYFRHFSRNLKPRILPARSMPL
jgi:hypothetical protein